MNGEFRAYKTHTCKNCEERTIVDFYFGEFFFDLNEENQKMEWLMDIMNVIVEEAVIVELI